MFFSTAFEVLILLHKDTIRTAIINSISKTISSPLPSTDTPFAHLLPKMFKAPLRRIHFFLFNYCNSLSFISNLPYIPLITFDMHKGKVLAVAEKTR